MARASLMDSLDFKKITIVEQRTTEKETRNPKNTKRQKTNPKQAAPPATSLGATFVGPSFFFGTSKLPSTGTYKGPNFFFPENQTEDEMVATFNHIGHVLTLLNRQNGQPSLPQPSLLAKPSLPDQISSPQPSLLAKPSLPAQPSLPDQISSPQPTLHAQQTLSAQISPPRFQPPRFQPGQDLYFRQQVPTRSLTRQEPKMNHPLCQCGLEMGVIKCTNNGPKHGRLFFNCGKKIQRKNFNSQCKKYYQMPFEQETYFEHLVGKCYSY